MKNQSNFKPSDLSVIRFIATLLLMFLTLNFSLYAQDVLVTGNVTDNSGDPLSGTLIMIKGSLKGIYADIDGNFTIKANPSSVLVVSFIGMLTKEVVVGNQTKLDIVLEYKAEGLSELVVIGYGSQSRRTITTAISKVQAETIEDVPVSSVANALQGKMAGVRIFQDNGGQPGTDGTIRIRGGSSINKSNSPLVIIDGVERGLGDINPTDIETIQVLKDASSTAIYGSRASNGVVLITTKKGKMGKAEIVLTTNFGIATPGKYMDMVDAKDYIALVRPAAARSSFSVNLAGQQGWGTGNSSTSPYSTRFLEEGEAIPKGYVSMPDPLDPTKTLIFQDNDFQRLTLKTGLEQKYYLSANGGTESIKYAASIGYTDIMGTAINTNYNRFTGRSNVTFKLNNFLTLITRMDHSTSKTSDFEGQRDIFARSIWIAPTTRLYMDDGSYGIGQSSTFTNPLHYSDNLKRSKYNYKTGIGATLECEIIPDLKFEVSGDYLLSNNTFETFEVGNIYSYARNSVFTYGQSKQSKFDAVLTYNKTIRKNHHINAVLGTSYLTIEDFNAIAQAQGSSSDLIYTLNAGPLKLDASTDRSSEALLGNFSRLTYDYKSKYLFGVSLRRDASSRFAPDNRVGYFPGISAGWVISEENFLKKSKKFSTLKLRGSIGQTGNNSIGRYAYSGIYNVGYDYYTLAGILPTGMSNPNLRWETTTQYDAGFDLGLLGDRIVVMFDYYTKITNDLLFSVPLPNESGFLNIDQNIGKVKFYGYEFEISADIVDNTNFKWSLNFNFAFNKDIVLELPDNGRDKNRIGGLIFPDGTGIGGIAEGERMGAIQGYITDGILDNWDQASKAKFDSQAVGWSPLDNKKVKGRKIPGDYEWKDIWEDGTIDEYDKAVLGYATPTTTGGIGNNFKYKNFDLNIFMDYALGHSIMEDVLFRSYGNLMDGHMTPTKNLLTDPWTQDGDYAAGKAKLPRFDIMDNKQQNNFRNSDVKVMKGDYLCLRELNISYNAPGKFLSKIKLKSVKLSFSIQNAYYFTAYKGWSPEYATTEGNYNENTYPIPRKFVFGLKIGF